MSCLCEIQYKWHRLNYHDYIKLTQNNCQYILDIWNILHDNILQFCNNFNFSKLTSYNINNFYSRRQQSNNDYQYCYKLTNYNTGEVYYLTTHTYDDNFNQYDLVKDINQYDVDGILIPYYDMYFIYIPSLYKVLLLHFSDKVYQLLNLNIQQIFDTKNIKQQLAQSYLAHKMNKNTYQLLNSNIANIQNLLITVKKEQEK